MRLSGILRTQCITIGEGLRDKPSVLAEIARLAKKSPALQGVSEEELRTALTEREELCSTGFGHGVYQDGNSLYFEVTTVVPAPGAAALALLGLSSSSWLIRRRRL